MHFFLFIKCRQTRCIFFWKVLVNGQGRNFGLKVGVRFRMKTRRPWVRSERGEKWRESIPFSSDSGVWESVMSSLSGTKMILL